MRGSPAPQEDLVRLGGVEVDGLHASRGLVRAEERKKKRGSFRMGEESAQKVGGKRGDG